MTAAHSPDAGFDPVWYLACNADVRATGMDPWTHYHSIGRHEGRMPAATTALTLDHMLWRGYADIALPVLERLVAHGSAREAAVAGWVLARWHLDCGAPDAARTALGVFWQHAQDAPAIAHLGPALLAIHLDLAAGNIAQARSRLDYARHHYALHANLDLAALTIALAGGEDTADTHLAALYKGNGLVSAHLEAGHTPPFNRLAAHAPQPVESGPLVSVIMPAYNSAACIAQALNGLCAQSWRALEILVVDDGSTDDTLEIARVRAASDPRIKVIAAGENHGAYPARNTGMAAATGEYITVHDADDWSHPKKIAAQIAPLLRNDTLMGSLSHWVRATDSLDMALWRIEQGWIHRNVSSLMIRAGLRDSLGYWDRTRANADTEYYYRIIAAYGAHSLTEVHPGIPLAFGRSTATSLTRASATHLRTQYHGPRRDYMEAASRWHRQAATPADLYLPQQPAQRPFAIPDILGVGDPAADQTPYTILHASALLDPLWYGLAHRDVLEADIDPARHYLEGGAREDRDTGPLFASGAYRIANDLGPEENPLLHWHTTGKAQGLDPLPGFDGALKDAPPDAPRVMVFAHAAGPALFGAERSLLDVIGRMVQRGQVPIVVLPSLRNRDYLARLRAVSARIEVVPQLPRHGWRTPDPATVTRLRVLIRQHAPVQIHVNTLVQDVPLAAARAEGVPAFLHIREMPHEDATLCRALAMTPEELRAQILDQADSFIVNSPLLAGWLDAPDRTRIRPNSVNPALFDLPYAPAKTLNVALISSNILKKGVADFLRIARQVETAGRPIRFLLIGPPTQDLHLLRPFPDNVDFRGYSATPLKAIAQADIVVNLSHFTESFGRTVMEAMAAARPVITYDRGTPAVLIHSGETGFVVPQGDTEAVARAILALEAARGQLAALGRAGRQRARALQALAERDI